MSLSPIGHFKLFTFPKVLKPFLVKYCKNVCPIRPQRVDRNNDIDIDYNYNIKFDNDYYNNSLTKYQPFNRNVD